jgi:sugar phosphate isomerase/epimerase
MYLSLATWAFARLTLAEVSAVAKAIRLDAIDISTRYLPGLDKTRLLADPEATAAGLTSLALPVANYFHHFGADTADRNLALKGSIEANVRELERVLTFADAASIPTVFFLPGLINPGQSGRQAFDISVDSLRAMMDVAAGFRANICIEPAMRSIAETPAMAEELVQQTGIGLALDYSHFVCLGYTQDQIDPLVQYAKHVHLRQARPGHLQAGFDKGTINFPAMFGHLRDAGYQGALAIEFIRQLFTNDGPDDVLTETVLMRDCFHSWTSGLPSNLK